MAWTETAFKTNLHSSFVLGRVGHAVNQHSAPGVTWPARAPRLQSGEPRVVSCLLKYPKAVWQWLWWVGNELKYPSTGCFSFSIRGECHGSQSRIKHFRFNVTTCRFASDVNLDHLGCIAKFQETSNGNICHFCANLKECYQSSPCYSVVRYIGKIITITHKKNSGTDKSGRSFVIQADWFSIWMSSTVVVGITVPFRDTQNIWLQKRIHSQARSPVQLFLFRLLQTRTRVKQWLVLTSLTLVPSERERGVQRLKTVGGWRENPTRSCRLIPQLIQWRTTSKQIIYFSL